MFKGAILIIYCLSSLLMAGLLVFVGHRFRRMPVNEFRITGSSLYAVAVTGVVIFIHLAYLSQYDAWGWSWFVIPLKSMLRMAIAFGVIWPLFVIVSLIQRKIHWSLLIVALPLLLISSSTVISYAQKESMVSRSFKGGFTRSEIQELLQQQKQHPEHRRSDSMAGYVLENHHGVNDILKNIAQSRNISSDILADYVEYGAAFAYEDIVRHPNVTPDLLIKIADQCSIGLYTTISMNGKTPALALEQMYKKTNDFYIRGWIVNNPNTPENLVTDFINTALRDSNRRNAYWAVAGVDRISPSLLEKLSDDRDDQMRLSVAHNYFTPIATIQRLLNDSNENVKYQAKENLRLRDSVREDLKKRYGVTP